jgi:hypothetical protein
MPDGQGADQFVMGKFQPRINTDFTQINNYLYPCLIALGTLAQANETVKVLSKSVKKTYSSRRHERLHGVMHDWRFTRVNPRSSVAQLLNSALSAQIHG